MADSVIECESARRVVGDCAGGTITKNQRRGLSGTDVLGGFGRVVGAGALFAAERDEILCITGL